MAPWKGPNEWVLNKAGVRKELKTVETKKLARKQGSCLEKEIIKEHCQVDAGEEDHAQLGWTTSRDVQNSSWKSQSEWQRTEKMEKVRSWCGQPSDRAWLKNRTE